MPQGSTASAGWFVKVINEVIKGSGQVAAYLDDVLVFDPDPTAHVKNMHTLFERLRKHILKFSPSKAHLGATDADFLGHSISRWCASERGQNFYLDPNADAAGPQAGACPAGRCGVLSQIPA